MNKGRPKDISKAKNRIHSVYLNVKAEMLYREICSLKKESKWFNDFLNKQLINYFSNAPEFRTARIAVLKKENEILGSQIFSFGEEMKKNHDTIEMLKGVKE